MQPARVQSAPASHGATAPHALLAQAIDHFVGGRFDRSRELYLQVLAIAPDDPVCLHHLGIIASRQGEAAEAESFIARAVAGRPDYAEAHVNHGAVLRTLGRHAEAAAALRRAIALAPDNAAAHNNLGGVLEDDGDREGALAAYRAAIACNDRFVEAPINAANLLRKMERPAAALATCRALLAARPDAAGAHALLGRLFAEAGDHEAAAAAYEDALRLQPNHVGALAGLGSLRLDRDGPAAAVAAFRAALDADATNVAAAFGLAVALESGDAVAEALHWYREALKLDPKLIVAAAQIQHTRRHCCDWDGLEADEAELLQRLQTTTDRVSPFTVVSLDADAALQRRVAEIWTKRLNATVSPYVHEVRGRTRPHRLRIGYLSADFCSHATANLMVGLFEAHDRARFEVFAYSYGPDDGSEMRARLVAGFDHFVEVGALSDRGAADRIQADGIDILIELKGFTRGSRMEIAALRPAPIQVSFIGFPGTSGCTFLDYVIADPVVLPMSEQPHWSERIVHLPDSYQPNDAQRPISPTVPTRAACGLPDDGFVFCCFNNTYKITPRVFDVWMRLVAAVPGSVLWLFDANAAVKDNLRAAAADRNVDPARLVFAPRLPKPDHLARQRLADLFLDTLPYNAHTTTSDALWVGLPVVTCIGRTFAGRVAASLLSAVGLPELITATLDDYEALALALARDPGRLGALRHRLAITRLEAPLFDTPRFARHLEAAFDRMWTRAAAGEEPEAFAVTPIGRAEPVVVAPTRGPARILYEGCPLCGNASEPTLGADVTKHRLYRPGMAASVAWHTCTGCAHVFTDGYFDAATRATFAATPSGPGNTLGHDMEVRRPAALRTIERVMRHRPPGGGWLDVGIGDGALLFAAEEAGYDPIGLDRDAKAAAELRTLGYRAICGTLDDVSELPDLAVLSLSTGLHREPFPLETILRAASLMRPGSALLLRLPNRDTMLWRLLQATGTNPHWGALDAFHAFGRARLASLLDACGFTPVGYAEAETYRSGMEIVALRR